MNFFKGFCLTIFISLTAGAPLLMMYASWEWGDSISNFNGALRSCVRSSMRADLSNTTKKTPGDAENTSSHVRCTVGTLLVFSVRP